MKTTAQLFNECLDTVSNDVRMELDMSFALADKIDAILHEKNISQKQLAKKWAKPKLKFLDGLEAHTILPYGLSQRSQTLSVSNCLQFKVSFL